MKRSWCILIFAFISALSSGQVPVFHNFTTADGLASSQVHDVIQDSKGFMWFATDAGVSRFDGFRFENFDSKRGLTDNDVFKVFEDHLGRIWCAPMNSRLCYIEGDSVVEYPFNDGIIDPKLDYSNYVTSLRVSKSSVVGLTFKKGLAVSIDQHGKKEHFRLPSSRNAADLFLEDGLVRIIWAYEKIPQDKPNEYLYKKVDRVIIHDGGRVSEINLPTNSTLSKLGNSSRMLAALVQGDIVLFSLSGSAYRIDLLRRQVTALQAPTLITQSSLITTKVFGVDVYIGTHDNGYFKCRVSNDSLLIVDHQLEGKSVSSIMLDSDGGCWLTTLRNGVFYRVNGSASRIHYEDKLLSGDPGVRDLALLPDVDRMYMLTTHNEMVELVGDSVTASVKAKMFTASIHIDENDELRSMSGRSLVRWTSNGKMLPYPEVRLLGAGREDTRRILRREGSLTVALGGGGLFVCEDDQLIPWITPNLKRLYHAAWLGDDLYVGGAPGLFITSVGDRRLRRVDLEVSITAIEVWNNSIIVGTESMGVFIKQDGQWRSLSTENGLPSDVVTSLRVVGDVVFVGTKHGLGRLDRNEEGFEVQRVVVGEGLRPLEIRDIEARESSLYLGTATGLYKLSLRTATRSIPPPSIYITALQAGDQEWTSTSSQVIIERHQRPVVVHFVGISYPSFKAIEYQYRLEPESPWTSTFSATLEFPEITPGAKTVEIRARSLGGRWSEPTTAEFTVVSALWERWWFVAALVLLVVTVLVETVRWREREIRRTLKLNERVNDLQSMALRAQMNPHFLFNALNAIQGLINVGDIERSNQYLSQFAHLVRRVLEGSSQKWVTIESELDVLGTYMELEKMRFSGQLRFSMNVDPSIDRTAKIPSMLIQPYLENAVLHGLQNATRSGVVELTISREVQDELQCVITDNGIGREAASKVPRASGSGRAVGLSLTERRLSLIAKGPEAQVRVIDLTENGSASGTKVILKIPIQHEE